MATSKSPSPTSRGPIRITDKKPLVRSTAVAETEIAKLRRGREDLETRPTEADTAVRATLI